MVSYTLLLAQAPQTPPPATGDTGAMLLIAIVLVILAIGLFMAEVMVPSGGVLGFISVACLIVGVVMLCMTNLTWGLLVAIIALLAIPFAIGFALKIWPDTPIGRWLTLANPAPSDKLEATPGDDPMIGKVGHAITDLRPIGTCMFDGHREQCLAIRGMIEAGQSVRVVKTEGMQWRVEAVEA